MTPFIKRHPAGNDWRYEVEFTDAGHQFRQNPKRFFPPPAISPANNQKIKDSWEKWRNGTPQAIIEGELDTMFYMHDNAPVQ